MTKRSIAYMNAKLPVFRPVFANSSAVVSRQEAETRPVLPIIAIGFVMVYFLGGADSKATGIIFSSGKRHFDRHAVAASPVSYAPRRIAGNDLIFGKALCHDRTC